MKEPCPACRKNGKDSAGDNLVRYEDGHAHCFACGFHIFADAMKLLENFRDIPEKVTKSTISLPGDISNALDYRASSWLAAFDIELLEVIRHKLVWSRSKSMLIFPVYSAVDGELLAWQGRSFASEGPKAYTEGPIHNILVPMRPPGKEDNSKIILVEDFVSAMKVSRHYTTVCMFGSSVTSNWIRRLKILTDTLYFWLDNDKAKEALGIAKNASLQGFKVKLIVTQSDPKRYSNSEIREAVEG